ncbi:hypothetical protein [Salinicoccus albus]|uniref:hypothetical protein n=1 Tax=Salinicoccus albus TaxID=418756 RepID=UPI0012EA88E9|nr:hypothetical protein [Salinicoccus albus]
MDHVLPFIASLILLNYLYRKKMIIYNLLAFAFLILSVYIISIFRQTFEYQIVNDTVALITDYIQIYFAGVYNVALSLEIAASTSQNIFITFLYDLYRPFLGLNLFWRSDYLNTSAELFNDRIFDGEQTTQIIPMLGQFYLPFGVLGVLVSSTFLVLTLYFFLRILSRSYIINGLIIIALIIRLLITPVQNFGIFMNEFSSIVLIMLSLNAFAYILRLNTKKEKIK